MSIRLASTADVFFQRVRTFHPELFEENNSEHEELNPTAYRSDGLANHILSTTGRTFFCDDLVLTCRFLPPLVLDAVQHLRFRCRLFHTVVRRLHFYCFFVRSLSCFFVFVGSQELREAMSELAEACLTSLPNLLAKYQVK